MVRIRFSTGAILANLSCANVVHAIIVANAINAIFFKTLLVFMVCLFRVFVFRGEGEVLEACLSYSVEAIHVEVAHVVDFFGAEESFELGVCGFGRVTGVDYVLLVAHAVVASYGAWVCLAAIGVACDVADYGYGVFAFETHGYDGGAHHGCLECREEGLACEMAVVLVEYLVAELHHLHACYSQSFLFETCDNLAYQTAHDGAGFQ